MNSSTLKNRRTKRTTITLEADVADFIQHATEQDSRAVESTDVVSLVAGPSASSDN